MDKFKERQQEKVREEFRKQIEDEEKMVSKLRQQESEQKIHRRKDFVRRLELERREASLNGVVLKAQEVSTLQQNQFQQEEKLAAELDLIRRQEVVDEKLRLHLRENSHELKELESQLKVAYVKKALAAQLAEREANKLEEQLRERRAREVLENCIGTFEEQEEALRLQEQIRKEEFRHSLQDQIIEKERMRQQEFISFLKERKMYDGILQKIKDDDERELEEKRLMQQKLREEMEQFHKACEMWKAKERFMIQEEDEKRKQINEEKARAEVQTLSEKKARQEMADKMYKKLSQELSNKKKQLVEREELVSSLLWNEKEEEEREKARKEAEKEMCRRQEARDSYKQHLAEKERKKREEKELDSHFAQQMKLKLQEEDRQDKEKQEKRRQMLINNRKYNEEAMKQNVQKRAESLKLTQLINELQEQEEKRKGELIEEERIKMLKEHYPKVLGYFPKGCLRQDDLDALGLTGNSPLPESCPLE